jgi:hypothetical protein
MILTCLAFVGGIRVTSNYLLIAVWLETSPGRVSELGGHLDLPGKDLRV